MLQCFIELNINNLQGNVFLGAIKQTKIENRK